MEAKGIDSPLVLSAILPDIVPVIPFGVFPEFPGRWEKARKGANRNRINKNRNIHAKLGGQSVITI